MEFSYNSNMDFKERVKTVAKEICSEYPLISEKDAMDAAAFAIPVDDHITNDDKFNRFYYIMMIIGRYHDEFLHVFNDAFKIYENGLENSLYQKTMLQIIDYVIGDRSTFPIFLEG